MLLIVQIYENNKYVRKITYLYQLPQVNYGEKLYKYLVFGHHFYFFEQLYDQYHP